MTLTGAVDSWSERRSAVDNAYQAGARKVIADLNIIATERTENPYHGPDYQWYLPLSRLLS